MIPVSFENRWLSCRLLFSCVFFLLFSVNASAQSLPLWELGVATGYASIPYYRGSASSRDVLIPMPLALYRGAKGLKSNKRQKEKRLVLAPSFAVGLPVPEGGQTGVRRNMPRLDATLEFGPKLSANLWKKESKGRRQALSINFPLRAVSSLSSRHADLQGWFFAPYFYYGISNTAKNAWALNIALGPQYGSADFHEYYYGVREEQALAGRASFVANAGYSGSRITVYAKKSINRLWVSVFARYDNLSGARFIDSPLVEKDDSLFSGFVIGWILAKSPQRVFPPN